MRGCLLSPGGPGEQGAADQHRGHSESQPPREDPPQRADRGDWERKPEHDAPGADVEGDSPALSPSQVPRIQGNEIDDAEGDRKRSHTGPVVGRTNDISDKDRAQHLVALSARQPRVRVIPEAGPGESYGP